MEANLNVNINLPQSELDILKKLAKALGWNLFVQQENDTTDQTKRQELIKKLYGCIQLPKEFDYKAELEHALSEKYKVWSEVITRNPKDFKHASISVYTPTEFLSVPFWLEDTDTSVLNEPEVEYKKQK